MPEAIEGVSTESVAPVIATDDTANDNVDNSASETITEETPVVTDETQESSETAETEAKPEDDPKIPQNFRDQMKALNADIKAKYKPVYTGLEKVSSDLFGSAEPEDVQAAIQTVQALAPTIKVITDQNSSQADVVSAIQKLLPAEHVEGLAWAALNDPATQDVIFADPEVLQTIAEKLFDGRGIEEIKALLANAPETEVDPEKEAWRAEQNTFRSEQARIKSENAARVADEQSNQLMTRFFEGPAQTVIVDDFKLVAPEGASEADKALFTETAKDIRFAAQGRFLEANMPAYMQINNLYRQGKGIQAQAAEIRLQNKYHATLIKVAERNSKLLESRSAATVNGQQDKINNVRPDVKGSVEGNGNREDKPYDVDDPGFMQRFQRDVNPAFHN